MTLVSVVIPVFDGERYLAEAIESALAQDHRPLEVIVVDDGSTDRSAEIAASFERVRVLRQEQRGPSAARNAGVAAATGECIAFHDADDVMLPRRVSAQLQHLRRHDVGCVLAHQRLLVEGETGPRPWLRPRGEGPGDGVAPMSALLPSETARGHPFDEALPTGEDTDWLMRLRESGVVIGVLEEVVTLRRVHGTNATAERATVREGLLRVVAAAVRRGRR